MKIKPLPFLIGLSLALGGSVATAGVNEKMNRMFGTTGNYTNPQVVETASGGVIAGGSVHIRNPIVSAGGFSFDPPQLSGGCGGIDMYGGNLSFPGKDQYVAVARAVVANIGGYAFKQGLKVICDVCESVMSSIQTTIDALNINDMNSCEIAKNIVDNRGVGAFVEGQKTTWQGVAESWRQTMGKSTDKFEASKNGQANKGNSEVAEAPGMERRLGNWTWWAMRTSGAFDWLGDDRRTREELMSLLGSVMSCQPGANGCPEGEKNDDLVARQLKPLLRLQDFVAPKDQRSEVSVYSCTDEENCYEVLAGGVKRDLGTNATDTIIKLLLGDPSEGKVGLMERMVSADSANDKLTSSERAILQASSDLFARAAACYAVSDRGRAQIIIEGKAPQIAADVLHTGINQSLTLLIAELNNNTEGQGVGQAVEMLEQSRELLAKQRFEIHSTAASSDTLSEAVNACSRRPESQALLTKIRGVIG